MATPPPKLTQWHWSLENFTCACAAPTVVVDTMPSGEPRISCSVCFASRPVLLVHYVWQMRMTACALPYSGARTNTLIAAHVTCPDCVDMLVRQLADVPEVDWRPAAAIAEDHYAL